MALRGLKPTPPLLTMVCAGLTAVGQTLCQTMLDNILPRINANVVNASELELEEGTYNTFIGYLSRLFSVGRPDIP